MSVGIAYTERRKNHETMILDGLCYSALIQFCRVILSRMVEPYLLSVFNLTFSGLDVCLW